MNKGLRFHSKRISGNGSEGCAEPGGASGGLAISSPRGVLGANDRVRVAVCGIRGRGFDHVKFAAQIPNVEVAALCEVDENIWRKRAGGYGEAKHPEAGAVLPGCAQAAGGQIHRRHFHRHAESLALLDRNLGLPGGQRRVRGETLLAQLVGRPPACARRAEIQSDCAAWDAEPLRALRPGGHPENSRRPARRRLPGARSLLQMAQHHWARSGGARARGRSLRSVDRPGAPPPLY